MRWTIKAKPDPNTVEKLAQELGVDTIIASLLVQRDINSFEAAKVFFRPLLSHLHDPFLMEDMEKAVIRIKKAIANGENILIYGDYDVDGTTAVTLLSSYLDTIYENVACYIPDRYAEGYGVSYKGIDFAHDNNISLIIALDCGIKAIEKVDYAKEKGIDFIICDHHRPGDKIPDAVAVLDPKRSDCDYPYKELCGCGIGFKLIQAINSVLGNDLSVIIPFLDLVAIAIAADIVPITGENRVLAYYGLLQINSNPRTGVKAMLQSVKKRELTVTDLVFIIAPRINAAGRIKHGLNAVKLLRETDIDHALLLADEIEIFNTERKQLDMQITKEALAQIQNNKEESKTATVVYNEDWHKGVIGIVASRLMETYYRPTLVFTKSGEKLAASARSVKGFDIYQALEACSDVLEQFGGHKYAAGLTLKEAQYPAFKAKFEEVVKKSIDTQLMDPEITVDTELNFNQITPKFYRILKQFAPFGPGNMAPVFLSQNIKDSGYAKGVGEDQKHLKAQFSQRQSPPFGVIGFNLGNKLSLVKNKKNVDVVYSLDENEWNGTKSIQLKLKDLR